MPPVRRGCHGTRHFIFQMRGGPHSDVKARHFFFCAGWWGRGLRRREKDSEMEDMSVFELDTAKIYIALHGKQEEDCTVKVRCSWLHCDIPLQRSETDKTCITATELFSFIEKCKQGGRYPCFAVETSLSGNRTWVFSSIDSADSSGVGYEVEAGNLIVLTQV